MLGSSGHAALAATEGPTCVRWVSHHRCVCRAARLGLCHNLLIDAGSSVGSELGTLLEWTAGRTGGNHPQRCLGNRCSTQSGGAGDGRWPARPVRLSSCTSGSSRPSSSLLLPSWPHYLWLLQTDQSTHASSCTPAPSSRTGCTHLKQRPLRTSLLRRCRSSAMPRRQAPGAAYWHTAPEGEHQLWTMAATAAAAPAAAAAAHPFRVLGSPYKVDPRPHPTLEREESTKRC